MDYFILKQDERYANTPVLRDVSHKIDSRNVNRFGAGKIADTLVFQVNADAESSFLDILDLQLYLISERLQKLIEIYEPGTIFKMIALIDRLQQRQHNYFLPIFEEVDALGPSSEFNLNRSVIKKLVLQADKIQGKKVFSIQESEKPLVIVRLDVAESILRRDFTGIRLIRVPLE